MKDKNLVKAIVEYKINPTDKQERKYLRAMRQLETEPLCYKLLNEIEAKVNQHLAIQSDDEINPFYS